MDKTIYQVDAFTGEKFSGNPAAVMILSKKTDEKWMQDIAAEMNLSETAFVIPEGDKLTIRWFTPVTEVNLCGHATLSAAHILFETGFVKPDEQIELNSRSGILRVTRSGKWITLDFPAYPLTPMPITEEFISVTGITPTELMRSHDDWVLALVDNEKVVRQASPDFAAMVRTRLGHLIVTSPSSESSFDFCSRVFVPLEGIDEDPVTGSAHCLLAPFWSEKMGKGEFMAAQISKRGGVLKLKLRDDRVMISGQAVTVFRAELL